MHSFRICLPIYPTEITLTLLRGVCLSGAGPSILALATSNFEQIAEAIYAILREAQDIRYDWQVLEVDHDGATCCDV